MSSVFRTRPRRRGYDLALMARASRQLERELGLDREDFGEFEIFGTDDRRLVTNTLAIPSRFICCIDSIFVNPNDGFRFPERGTGTLISDRHVLTAAHVVFDDVSTKNRDLAAARTAFPIRYVTPNRLIVSPARNGQTFPVGTATVTNIRVARGWQAVANRQQAEGNRQHLFTEAHDDFALLTLNTSLGTAIPARHTQPLGFWGHPRLGGGTRIRPIEISRLRNQIVNVAGYPIDKCLDQPPNRAATADEIAACTGHVTGDPDLRDQGSTQWVSTGTVIDPAPASAPRTITHDVDTVDGHSGCPLWLRWEQARNLVAINTGGFPEDDPPFRIVANQGVRITEQVLEEIRGWMRSDRVEPTF